jgi:DNA-binding transcriptional regulator YiaG
MPLGGDNGPLHFRHHALDRMQERNATRGDVRSALSSASLATFQSDNGRWKVTGGTDRSGDALDMAVVFENGLVVITVF